MESGALCARRLQRGFSAARRGPRIRPVRNICGGFRGSGEVAGQSRTSSHWLGGGAGRFALRFRRYTGRIYRIVYRDGAEGGAANVTPCPSATAPAGNPVEVAAEPPEGTHPDAGAAAGN